MSTTYWNPDKFLKRLHKSVATLLGALFVMHLAGVEMSDAQNRNSGETIVAQHSTSGISDEANVMTIRIYNRSLAEALEIVAEKANVGIYYNTEVIPDQQVTLNMKDVPIHVVLYTLLEGTNLEPVLLSSGDVIVIRDKEEILDEMAQQTVYGRVTDGETGEPLPGVNVVVMGSEEVGGSIIGTQTDLDGNYSLNVPEDIDILIFSYIGYRSEEVEINGRFEIDVVLQLQTVSGEELLVVGYGTQKRINLTGAVSQITTEKIQDRPVSNLSQALQGAIPNLNVIIGSGQPGTSGRLNIRGNTSITSAGEPLILIDGVPGDLDRVNPKDVESISVLKDASASAIYGARAAFGVILITTKTAQPGETTITYSNNFSWKTHAANTNFMTAAYDHMRLNEEAYYNALGNYWSGYTEEDYHELYIRRNDKTEHPDRPWIMVKPDASGHDVYKYYGNFDWFNYFFSEWRPKQEHNLNIMGGTEKFSYLLSLSNDNEQGIWKQNPDHYERNTIRTKVDYEIFPWLMVSNNTSFFNSNYAYYGKEGGGFPSVNNNLTTNQIYMLSPAYLPQNPDGSYTYLTDNGLYAFGYGAHIAAANKNLKGNNTINDFTSKIETRIDLMKELSIVANYAYNLDSREQMYRGVRLQYSLHPGIIEQVPRGEWDRDVLKETTRNDRYHVINIFGNYQNSFNFHNLEVTGGFNQEEKIYKRTYAEGHDLLSETLNDLSHVTGEMVVRGGASEWALRGLFYRVNYDYNGKYLFEASGRYDGTSRFREGDRFGFFPSFSAGWRLSQENFFKPLSSIFNEFKIRASYGTLGNQQVDTYAYISSMSANNLSYISSGERLIGVTAPNPIDPTLTWERTTTSNLGIDFWTFDSRLSVEFDAYIRDTKGMLVRGRTLPSVFGASEPRENAADLRTKGFELNLNWRDSFYLGNSLLSYNIGFILSDYTGTITKFDNPSRILTDYYEGQRLGEIWGFVYDGFFETTEEAQAYSVNQDLINRRRVNAPTNDLRMLQAGDIKIIDLNGDGVIDFGANTVDDPGDRRVIGNSQPRFSFGIPLGASWKGIDLYILFQGIGRQHYYPDRENQMFWHSYARPYGTFYPENFEDMIWRPDNPDAYFPRHIGYIAQNSELMEVNDMYLQDLAYIKLRNLTLGYNLPVSLTTKVGLKHARIYVSGENLFTWTKMDTDYIDPEEVMWDRTGRTYPIGKTFSTGLEVRF